MNQEPSTVNENPLASKPVIALMLKFAIPSIVAMVVGAIYNLVDQAFLGNRIGTVANSATNNAFPFSIACLSMALLFGIGGASAFNLTMGKGDKEEAPYYVGNSACMLVLCGTILAVITEVFLRPLLICFGTPGHALPYAMEYVRITAIGFPFLMFTTGGGHLIRADGSPFMTMLCNIVGAVINILLDAWFVLGLDWGMFGAALATVIAQVISATIVLIYLMHYKTVPLRLKHCFVHFHYLKLVMSIGMGSCINQLAMMVVQIVLNNALKNYGAQSAYGDIIPSAAAGIVMKVAQLCFSVVIGIAQGSQPVESFNYGAKNYKRVREAYTVAMIAGFIVSVPAFLMFQLAPRWIIMRFGEGTEVYYQFAEKYFRIYLFFTILNFIQPITATFFTSIGKAFKGAFLSLTRQILFLLPLIIVLPLYVGIDGILYSGPIADVLALLATGIMAFFEFRGMAKEERARDLQDIK